MCKIFFYSKLKWRPRRRELREIVAQITLDTSNSRNDCYSMNLSDLFNYYNDLCDENEKRNKELEKRMKTKG